MNNFDLFHKYCMNVCLSGPLLIISLFNVTCDPEITLPKVTQFGWSRDVSFSLSLFLCLFVSLYFLLSLSLSLPPSLSTCVTLLRFWSDVTAATLMGRERFPHAANGEWGVGEKEGWRLGRGREIY